MRVWSLLDPARLKPRVARALEDRENEICLSPTSVWELTVLARKGRIVLSSGVEDWVAEAFAAPPCGRHQ